MMVLNFKFHVDRACRPEKEAHVRDAFAHDDGIGVGEMTAVDVDGKVAVREAGERSMHASLKFVVRRARADRFPDGERDKFANA